MAEFEANFDIQPVQIEADFSISQPSYEASFEIYASGDDKFFVYEQATASDTWEVRHNLNKKPSITVVDSAENVVEGDYTYLDENSVVLRFNSAFVGKAFFN